MARSSVDDEVFFDEVVGFGSVLDEHSMAHRLVSHVSLQSQIMHAVKGKCSIESVVNGEAARIRLVHRANHVEVHWVAAELERLTHQLKLDVAEATDEGLVAWRVHEDVRAVHVLAGRGAVTLQLDVAGEEADFSAHIEQIAIKVE